MMGQARKLISEGSQISKQVFNNLLFVTYLLVLVENQEIYKKNKV